MTTKQMIVLKTLWFSEEPMTYRELQSKTGLTYSEVRKALENLRKRNNIKTHIIYEGKIDGQRRKYSILSKKSNIERVRNVLGVRGLI